MNRKTNPFPGAAGRIAPTVAGLAFGLLALPIQVPAQTINPYYSSYNIRALGEVPGLPYRYGGLTFEADDPNTLLIGGNANSDTARIFKVAVVRGANGHVIGFSGSATYFADAQGLVGSGGGIDGGLIYGPGNVLFYASYDDDSIGQVKPGQSSVSKQTDLNTLGISGSPGSLVLVPAGLPGAGRLKILTYNGSLWYDTALSPDGSGTYNFSPASTPIEMGNMGLEGAFYVAAGNPQFPKASVLVADYSNDRIVSFEVNANGDPLPATARDFVTDVNSVEGAALDPLTGDFVFSSFSYGQVWVVGGFGIAQPTVIITSPTNNATFAAPASFMIFADAAQPGGAIAEVDFYVDGGYQGTSWNAPYTIDVNNLAAGQHALTAVAYGSGMSKTSSVVNITVISGPPSLAIQTPGDNTSKNECADVVLSATAHSNTGSVTNVAYYLSASTLLASATQSPYRLAVSLPVGTNQLTAVATDNLGAMSTSAVVRVIFTATPTNTMVANVLASGALKLCFRGLPSNNYVFESTTSLGPSQVWTPFVTNQASAAQGGLISVLQTIQPISGGKYYRARRQP